MYLIPFCFKVRDVGSESEKEPFNQFTMYVFPELMLVFANSLLLFLLVLMQGCGSYCNLSFLSVSSKIYTHRIRNKNAARSNCLKITCIMMNVMYDRDVNAFLSQWYFLNGDVCPTWTGLLWINIALLLIRVGCKIGCS